jgi:hypothetical protein
MFGRFRKLDVSGHTAAAAPNHGHSGEESHGATAEHGDHGEEINSELGTPSSTRPPTLDTRHPLSFVAIFPLAASVALKKGASLQGSASPFNL